MKTVKEEIKKEIIDVHTFYEAIDGTLFKNQEECKKYEETAKCLIRSKVMPLIVSKGIDAWELMGGVDEHTVTAFKPVTSTDADNLKQFLLIECTWYASDERKSIREKIFSVIDEALKNKDVVLFGQNIDDDYYFIDSRHNIVNRLNNLDREELENAQM